MKQVSVECHWKSASLYDMSGLKKHTLLTQTIMAAAEEWRRDVELLTLTIAETNHKLEANNEVQHHRTRTVGEIAVQNFLQKWYGPALQEWWETTTLPSDFKKSIIIVERRCAANLLFCIQNACYQARDQSLMIFCSKENLAQILQILGRHIDQVAVVPIFEGYGTAEQGKSEQNQALQHKLFWNLIPSEIVLTIETDSYLLRPITADVEQQDQNVSQWHWLQAEPGGGGISLRKRSVMLAICEKQEAKQGHAQDVFAADGVKALGYSWNSQYNHFCESCFTPKPIGVHQWWNFANQYRENREVLNQVVQTFLQCIGCPRARGLAAFEAEPIVPDRA